MTLRYILVHDCSVKLLNLWILHLYEGLRRVFTHRREIFCVFVHFDLRTLFLHRRETVSVQSKPNAVVDDLFHDVLLAREIDKIRSGDLEKKTKKEMMGVGGGGGYRRKKGKQYLTKRDAEQQRLLVRTKLARVENANYCTFETRRTTYELLQVIDTRKASENKTCCPTSEPAWIIRPNYSPKQGLPQLSVSF